MIGASLISVEGGNANGRGTALKTPVDIVLAERAVAGAQILRRVIVVFIVRRIVSQGRGAAGIGIVADVALFISAVIGALARPALGEFVNDDGAADHAEGDGRGIAAAMVIMTVAAVMAVMATAVTIMMAISIVAGAVIAGLIAEMGGIAACQGRRAGA
jgi:hypothetical protein